MLGGMKLRWTVGLCTCFGVVGCVGLGRTPDRAPLPSPAPGPRAAPDLRIREDAIVRAPDIPLVPLPSLRPDAPPPATTAPLPSPAPVTKVSRSPSPAAATNGPDGAPAPPPAAAVPTTAREVHQQATARYATMSSYIARLTRREFHKDKMQPEQLLLFKFRKEPWSVYFKWLGKEGHGREVLYVKGEHGDKIHSLLAEGDFPFMPAGKRMALAPDNVFVRNASRHPITEAGIGSSIERLGTVVAGVSRGDPGAGALKVLPALVRPEFSRPVMALEHVIPAGVEGPLPGGGRRLYCFDPENNLPVLIQTRDSRGQEVEYYFYDRLQFPVKLDADDFNPDTLWGKPRKRAAAGAG